MTLLETLLLPRVLGVLFTFALLAMAEPVLEGQLNRVFRNNGAFDWCWDRLLYPLLRAVLIMALVIALYPALFGLSDAPEINRLFALGHARLNTLLGVLFLFTLVLPALPVLSRHVAFVLPLQGFMATAIIYSWLADYLGVTLSSLFPGPMLAATLIVLAWAAWRLAQFCAEALGSWLDAATNVSGTRVILGQGMLLLVQGPIIVVYGYTLGRQIAI
jgi:hypothetical protein